MPALYGSTLSWKRRNRPRPYSGTQPTGAIIYTANTKHLDAEEIIESCPYNIPRKGPNGALAKCDMCLDRVQNGLLPACVKTCPTGAMKLGIIHFTFVNRGNRF